MMGSVQKTIDWRAALATCVMIAMCSWASAQNYGPYVDERKSISGVDADATASLRAMLEKEVDKVVTPNVHLAPVWYQRGIGGNPRMYGNPAELVYALLLARNYVSAPLQTKINTYVTRELNDYPLWTNNWVSAGTRRERWVPPSDRIDSGTDTGSTARAYINLYVLWYYGLKTGDTARLNTNWTAITTLYSGIGTPTTYTYPQVIGIIGYARMAQMLGKTTEYTNARTKAIAALTNVDTAGFVTIHVNAETAYADLGHNWYFTAFQYRRDSRGNGRSGAFYVPELGRFLKDQDLANVQTDMNNRILAAPYGSARESWWMNYGDQPWGYASAVGGENNTMGPDYAYQVYMIQADILGASAQQLKMWIDIPFVNGDSYWMARVVRAIEAYGTESWVAAGAAAPAIGPAALTATASGSGIALTWTGPVGKETVYRVERRSGDGTWAQLATTASTVFFDPTAAGNTYVYRVALGAAYSNEVSATAGGRSRPAPR